MPDGGLAAGGAGWTVGPGARGVAQPSAPLVPGATDHQVLQLNNDAKARMTGVVDLVTVEGATHLFEEPGTLEAAQRLALEWFERYVG